MYFVLCFFFRFVFFFFPVLHATNIVELFVCELYEHYANLIDCERRIHEYCICAKNVDRNLFVSRIYANEYVNERFLGTFFSSLTHSLSDIFASREKYKINDRELKS